jgi:hypothetical protein
MSPIQFSAVKTASCLFSSVLFAILAGSASFGVAQDTTHPDIAGKVVFGYQGWFSCPGGPGFGSNWTHWSFNGEPNGTNMQIEMYPDLAEFDTADLCPTSMTVQGKPAYLFSPETPAVIDKHFEWMKQYGLDGVLLQRFLSDIPGKRRNNDTVIQNVLNAARKHGRVLAVEYDMSGADTSKMLALLQSDWMYLVDTLKILEHPGYLHHNGRPVMGLWGLGLGDGNHRANANLSARTIKWFRQDADPKYRVTYLGGTPDGWRTLTRDAFTETAWNAVYDSMDIIQPWAVGRYSNISQVNAWYSTNLVPDNNRTVSKGQAYQPVIFPGFSWRNLQRGAAGSPLNQIPRLRGEFLWRQAINAKKAGAPMLKIAMYDEVNEGTAMFKLARTRKQSPDQGSTWLTLDADGDTTLPSDWYLRMAGAVTRMFRGEIPVTDTIPIKSTDPWPPATSINFAKRNSPAIQVSRFNGGMRFTAPFHATEIRIIDLQGRNVRVLNPVREDESSSALWDGSSASGTKATPGIYQIILQGADGSHASISFAWMGY